MADNAKWYVAHTYSGYENAVKTAIEKFVANRHLEDMILDIQIPLETVTEVTDWARRRKSNARSSRATCSSR